MMPHKMSSSKRSSTDISSDSDDLLIEILLCLPAKSLIRFQLVSKHWRSLIAARSFSHLHTFRHFPRSKSQPSFIICRKSQPSLLTNTTTQFFICHPTVNRLVPIHFPFPNVKILQSCNGLLLLECRDLEFPYRDYYVCNPTTMQSRNLNLKLNTPSSGPFLVFDPYKSSHYKVFCFRTEIGSRYIQFSVYDSETHEWKEGGEFDRETCRFLYGIRWNDRTYFIRPRGYLPFCLPRCLSLEDERIYIIPERPRIHSAGRKKTYTIESNGHLHYITLSLKPDEKCLFVFEMKDDCWFEKYRADFNPISASFAGNNGTDISLLGMIRGEREEDSIVLFHVPGKIIIYRFFDKIFEDLVDLSTEYNIHEGRWKFGFKDAGQFIASLAPV